MSARNSSRVGGFQANYEVGSKSGCRAGLGVEDKEVDEETVIGADIDIGADIGADIDKGTDIDTSSGEREEIVIGIDIVIGADIGADIVIGIDIVIDNLLELSYEVGYSAIDIWFRNSISIQGRV